MKTMTRRVSFLFVWALVVLLSGESFGWWWSRPRAAATRPHPKARVHAKTYQYVRDHDLNGDGIVDNRDRLMWAERHQVDLQNVLVSKENADLFEAMDVNNDGNIESWEIKQFYSKYDLNKNGVLEIDEIDAALEQ